MPSWSTAVAPAALPGIAEAPGGAVPGSPGERGPFTSPVQAASTSTRSPRPIWRWRGIAPCRRHERSNPAHGLMTRCAYQLQRLDHLRRVALSERHLCVVTEVQMPLRVRGIQREPACGHDVRVANDPRQHVDQRVVAGAPAVVRELACEERDVAEPEIGPQIRDQRVHFAGPARIAVVGFALVKQDAFDHAAGLLRELGALDDPAVLRAAVFKKVSIFSPLIAHGTRPIVSPAGILSINVFEK